MDGLDASAMLPPPDMGDLGAPKKPPGRPPADPVKRALADERYAKVVALQSILPAAAKDFRFAYYRAKKHSDQKRDMRPLGSILLSVFIENNLSESEALYTFLADKHGPGRYLIEAQDEHKHRIDRVPTWVVPDGDTDMSQDEDEDDEFEDDDRPRRRGGFRRARGRFREDEDDDEGRANVGELLHTANQVAMGHASSAGKQTVDMMGIMMMNMNAQTASREADAKREAEVRAEDRRREEVRSEERRREALEERRRQEDRDDRDRKEARDRERAEDERRQLQYQAANEASNRRLQMMLGGITALAPVLMKVLEKKDDPMQAALLARMLEPPAQDPVMAMLLKGVMDKTDRKDSAEMMMEQFIAMSRMGAEMQGEQMKAMMANTNEMNKVVMSRAIEMMSESPQGQTPEGQDMISKIATIISGATEMVKTLAPPKPPVQVMTMPVQPQQRRQFPHNRPALPAPAQGQPQQPGQGQQAPAQPAPPAEPAQAPEMPTGMVAVLGGLKAIHKKMYRNQEEYQGLLRLVIEQMPVDLRVHVIKGNEMGVLSLTLPWVRAQPEFAAWFEEGATGAGESAVPATIDWVREFVPQLVGSLVAVHGPIEKQESDLAQALAAEGLVPVEQAAQGPAPEAPPAPPEQPPEASAPVPAPTEPTPDAGGALAVAEPAPVVVVPDPAPDSPV